MISLLGVTAHTEVPRAARPGWVLVDAGELRAVAEVRDSPPPLTIESMARHAAALTDIMRHTTVVPARLPTPFADEPALRAWLHAHRTRLLHDLESLSGCVEMAVRAVARPEGLRPALAGSGRDFMMERVRSARAAVAAEAAAKDALDALHQRLAAAARSARRTGAASGAYLVAAGAAGAFEDLVLAAKAPRGVEVFCTGPWPAFSFVTTGFPGPKKVA
jgi:hypothetical protein